MSKYIEDVQGKIASNPINETNTKYGYIPSENGVRNADNYNIDTQYMYNNGEPVSSIDTDVYDDYRNTIEDLRTKTESRYESMQACLIPTEISGMAFRPYEFRKSEDEYGEEIQEKIESFTYFFQDHMSPISMDTKEFVFRTNKVKFISDRHRRLNYDRQIHLMTSKEDEVNSVSFASVIYRTFFVYEENTYVSRVKNKSGVDMSYNDITTAIYNDITTNHYEYTVIDNGAERKLTSKSDFNLPFKSGQSLNTLVPSTLYNLHNIGWVDASVIFLNGLIIPWNKILLSVDNIDTFIIVYDLGDTISKLIEDQKEVVLDYIHIPFKVEYITNSITTTTPYYKKYITSNKLNKDLIFIIDKTYSSVRFNSNTSTDYTVANLGSNVAIDRIICLDGNIRYGEFALGTDDSALKDLNIEYTKSFKSFCDNDYRCKLKRFNFLGFEFDRYWDNDTTLNRATFKNDDFTTDWHPFNIIDIHFDRMYHSRRIVKVFYNVKVLYDQDNVLRIKNQDSLSVEYERYRHDITGNIAAYLDEIYTIAKTDIGTYIATTGKMNGYRYTYVTPYECYLIYNAFMKTAGRSVETFDGFRKINILGDGNVRLNYINGGFIATEKSDTKFNRMIKDTDIFTTSGSVKPEYITYIRTMVAKGCTYTDILMPIDNEIRTKSGDFVPVSNTFEIFEGDTKGKIIPYLPYMDKYDLVQEYDDVIYDKLKLRFEMGYLNNVEEGATPVDEFIYYFDNNGFNSNTTYPVVNASALSSRRTAITLYAAAKNMFKVDPNLILPQIEKVIYSADYIIPTKLSIDRVDYIVTADKSSYTDKSGYNYKLDPHYFYNYGYYDSTGKPVKLASEYSLRRNLPELFYWTLDNNQYTLNSMQLLDNVFDFTYDPTKTYMENLKSGTNYVIGYDADKLERSIKRSVVSFTKTGKELKQIMALHPCKKDCTLDGYKLITFVKNSNQKVAVDNILITVNMNGSTINSITYTDYNGGSATQFNTVSMKHRSQDHYSVTKTNSSFTYVDKAYTQSYTSVKYNNSTEMLEYYNGSELVVTVQVDYVVDTSRVQMSRWTISSQENYVMIFKNRQLYDKYSEIEYTDVSFSVPFSGSDTDVFEFVFFLNANNTILKKEITSVNDIKLTVPNSYYSTDTSISDKTTLNSAIACETSILEPEYIQLLTNVAPTYDLGQCTTEGTENTAYELSFSVKSYEASVATDQNYRRMQYKLSSDTKLNGLHRVTKQGGGEYFLEFNGNVPANNSEEFGGYDTNRHLEVPYNLYLSSKRQFRYKGFTVTEDQATGYIYLLNVPEYDEEEPKSYVYKTGIDNFKFCIDPTHLLVFKNGLLLPKTAYFMHSIVTTPIKDTGVVFNVPIKKNDKIDIFYVTNDLKYLDTEYYNTSTGDRYISNGLIKIANNGKTEVRVMGDEVNSSTRANYIRFRSPLYAISSKDSVFVFLNGKKVRLDELNDISDTIMSINTTYGSEMNAVRLEVMNHLDTQDIIERLYINDGLAHNSSIANQYKNNTTGSSNVYKSTLQVDSFKLSDLEAYSKRTKLDELLNDLSYSKLNKLFYNYSSASGPTTPYNFNSMNDKDFITREQVYDSIIRRYYDVKPEDFVAYDIVRNGSHTLIYMKDDDFNVVVCRLDRSLGTNISIKDGAELIQYASDNDINVVITHIDKMISAPVTSKKDGNDWYHTDSLTQTIDAEVEDNDILII